MNHRFSHCWLFNLGEFIEPLWTSLPFTCKVGIITSFWNIYLKKKSIWEHQHRSERNLKVTSMWTSSLFCEALSKMQLKTGVCKLLHRISTWNTKWLCEGMYTYFLMSCVVLVILYRKEWSFEDTPAQPSSAQLCHSWAAWPWMPLCLGHHIMTRAKIIWLMHCFPSAGVGAPTSAALKMPPFEWTHSRAINAGCGSIGELGRTLRQCL